ncbi:unnamed protein product [Sphagnum tenellum]
MTGIYKIDDSDNQPGHWFYLDITKPEMDNIRTWLKQNLGRSTRMTGSVSTGWVPLHADRQWTIMSDAQSYKKPRESYLPIKAALAAGRGGLKRAQSLVGTSEGRPDYDYYPTPPEATEALLRVETFTGTIWECAAGNGAISKVLEAHGHTVVSTDLIDRGFGEAPHDFLTSSLRYPNVITNPPFTLAEQFVQLSLGRTTGKVAILGKLQFLEGAKRKIMFENSPLKSVWVFSKRLTMTRNGEKMDNSGMICFGWILTMEPTDRESVLTRLWESDEASALTNQGARVIERLMTALRRADADMASAGFGTSHPARLRITEALKDV